MSGMIPEIISSAPKHAAEIFKAPHRLGVRVIGEDRAEQEPAQMHTRNNHGRLPSTGHEMASCAHADLPAVPPPLTKVVGAVLYLGACQRGPGQVTRRPGGVNVPAAAGWCQRAAPGGAGRP